MFAFDWNHWYHHHVPCKQHHLTSLHPTFPSSPIFTYRVFEFSFDVSFYAGDDGCNEEQDHENHDLNECHYNYATHAWSLQCQSKIPQVLQSWCLTGVLTLQTRVSWPMFGNFFMHEQCGRWLVHFSGACAHIFPAPVMGVRPSVRKS